MRWNYVYGALIVAVLLGGVLLITAGPSGSKVPSADAIEPAREQASPTTTEHIEVLNEVVTSISPDTDLNGNPVVDHYDTTSTTTGPAPSATNPSSNPPASTTTTVQATTTTQPQPDGHWDSGAEASFAGKINSLRSSNGLGALTRSGSLDSEARAWAKVMGDQGSLSHSNVGRLVPPWSAAAENSGSGGSVDSIFGALAGSGGHLNNMLGDYTHFGVGVWIDGSGKMWTVHLFTR